MYLLHWSSWCMKWIEGKCCPIAPTLQFPTHEAKTRSSAACSLPASHSWLPRSQKLEDGCLTTPSTLSLRPKAEQRSSCSKQVGQSPPHPSPQFGEGDGSYTSPLPSPLGLAQDRRGATSCPCSLPLPQAGYMPRLRKGLGAVDHCFLPLLV